MWQPLRNRSSVRKLFAFQNVLTNDFERKFKELIAHFYNATHIVVLLSTLKQRIIKQQKMHWLQYNIWLYYKAQSDYSKIKSMLYQ